MGNMTIFTSACDMPGTSVLRDVDGHGLQQAGRARVAGQEALRGVRLSAPVFIPGVMAVVKQLNAPVVIGANGEVGPHSGRPPI